VTTSDGHSDPIVWIVGAEGDGRLHGFRGDTGEPLLAGGGSKEAMAGLRHLQTLVAAENRLFVAPDDRVYAFAFEADADWAVTVPERGRRALRLSFDPPAAAPAVLYCARRWRIDRYKEGERDQLAVLCAE
jgi:hypothetical protein